MDRRLIGGVKSGNCSFELSFPLRRDFLPPPGLPRQFTFHFLSNFCNKKSANKTRPPVTARIIRTTMQGQRTRYKKSDGVRIVCSALMMLVRYWKIRET